jgi:hypothetical protein
MEGLCAKYHAAAAARTDGNTFVAEAVLLAHDAAAFACLWHSCSRDQAVLNSAWETLYADGKEQHILVSWPSWLAQTVAGLPCQLPPYVMAIPHWKKTERACQPQNLWQERAASCVCCLLASWSPPLVVVRLHPRGRDLFSEGFSSRNFDVIGASALAQRVTRVCTKHMPQGTMRDNANRLTRHITMKVVSEDFSCFMVGCGARAACAEVSTGSVEVSKAKQGQKGPWTPEFTEECT